MKRIAIVGGGLSGLSAAYELERSDTENRLDIQLFEANDRLGGVLCTEQAGPYLIENSADMFTTQPSDAMDLIDELGKSSEILSTQPVTDRAFIGFGQQLHRVPPGFALMQPSQIQPILETKLLTWEGKARLLGEMHLPQDLENDDESLRAFATRRFGREAFERLIQPLAAGIYTADPSKLSMNATMSRFVEAVETHGSLIRAGLQTAPDSPDKSASGARYELFRAPKQGMGQLIEWLQQALEITRIHLSSPVESLATTDGRWHLTSSGKTSEFDQIILACAPRIIAPWLEPIDPILSEHLKQITAASAAIIVIGAKRTQLQKPFDGYGVIFPSCENRKLIATSFTSNKFAERTTDDRVLIRGFVGGALAAENVEESDETLIQWVMEELRSWFGLTGEPEMKKVYRWRHCMPQYHLNHDCTVQQIEARCAEWNGLELAGNSYHGVGIPACIRSGRQAARRILNG